MKLFSQSELVVDEYGSVDLHMRKEPEFVPNPYSNYTGGNLKYLMLPQGTRVRITVEVIEENV